MIRKRAICAVTLLAPKYHGSLFLKVWCFEVKEASISYAMKDRAKQRADEVQKHFSDKEPMFGRNAFSYLLSLSPLFS